MSVALGYILLDPRIDDGGTSRVFFAPAAAQLDAIGPGDRVQLMFEHVPRSDKWAVERMWVVVEMVDGASLRGTLINRPFEHGAAIHPGQVVEFERHHIISVERAARAVSA